MDRVSYYVPPRNAVESKLEQIWKELLSLNQVGIHDDFFELGGYSLLAVRLMSQIEKEFSVKLSLSMLMEQPTIAHLSEHILNHQTKSREEIIVTLQSKGIKPPLFCVHPVGGSVFSYVPLSRRLGNYRPFYGIQSPGFNGVELPETIEDIASLYLSVIRSMQKQGPYNLSGWSFGGVVAFEMAQQLRQSGDEISELILIESYTPAMIRKLMQLDGSASLDNLAPDVICLLQFALSLFNVASIQELPKTIIDSVNSENLYQVILDKAIEQRKFNPESAEKEFKKHSMFSKQTMRR